MIEQKLGGTDYPRGAIRKSEQPEAKPSDESRVCLRSPVDFPNVTWGREAALCPWALKSPTVALAVYVHCQNGQFKMLQWAYHRISLILNS
jgi:hypothetical protein